MQLSPSYCVCAIISGGLIAVVGCLRCHALFEKRV